MRKDNVIIKRKDVLKEMAIKLGIYEDFDINDFLGIVADTVLDTENPEAPHYGYCFTVVDDDYEYKEKEIQYDPAVFK